MLISGATPPKPVYLRKAYGISDDLARSYLQKAMRYKGLDF